MKKFSVLPLSFIFLLLIVFLPQCKKPADAVQTDCKTCRAFNAGVDNGTVQRQVCSAAEETAFRNEFAGKEISCQ